MNPFAKLTPFDVLGVHFQMWTKLKPKLKIGSNEFLL